MKLLTEGKLKVCTVMLIGYLLTIITNTFKNDYLLVLMCMIFGNIPNFQIYNSVKKMCGIALISSTLGWFVSTSSNYIQNIDLILFPIGGYIVMTLIDKVMKKKSGILVITYIGSFLFDGNFGDQVRVWKDFGEAILVAVIISYLVGSLLKRLVIKYEN